MLAGLFRFCLDQRLVVGLLFLLLVGVGVGVAPFDWELGIPRSPVPVDAIPDLGENQQVVFTAWPGRSPQDIEDQVTYPLTVSLLGMPGIKTIRSNSMFGVSSIYVIFEEGVDFYWSRSRILEKLASLPAGSLPAGVKPSLGPDATALGQVFWYTLEGRTPEGKPVGGWDLDELRSIQDWQIRYALMAAGGVAEVASVGGFVREYQIDVDPDAMRAHGVRLDQVFRAAKRSNLEVGARTVEMNRVEYFVRGLGWVDDVADLENSVIRAEDGVPVRVRDIATVALGPAIRRGALDKGGSEAVGGVVVVRHGENPLEAIKNIKAKIEEIAPSLPSRKLADGTVSQVTVVPFYDRTELIVETLGTLEEAISLELLVTLLVVVFMVRSLRASFLVGALLPVAVLAAFIAMKVAGIDANVVALSGIAIAIGTMVDMGIVLTESIVRKIGDDPNGDRKVVIREASREVGSAVMTSVATTVVSFLPVFTMTGAEGKLFGPLAFTKTFALLGALLIALVVIPPAASLLFRKGRRPEPSRERRSPANWLVCAAVGALLAFAWEPLGPEPGRLANLAFVLVLVAGLLSGFELFRRAYPRILAWCLGHKLTFLVAPALVVVGGGWVWSGMGREFMPRLEEGSFLYMPTTMPHASMGETLDVLSRLDRAIESVPEVDTVVGKIGRVDSALDPAPLSMVETVILYKPEYTVGRDGERVRQWRDHIRSQNDIWDAIVDAAQLTGTTSAPYLQPIEARIVMLQTGMRAPMGIKVQGPSLESIEAAGFAIEAALKEVPEVSPPTVVADRVVGKPYLEIEIDREAAARYGISVQDAQDVIQIAIGGKRVTTTVEGRERYPVRVRYKRELRDDIESLMRVVVPTASGAQIPLESVATVRYARGPQSIKTEDTFLTSYVLFDRHKGRSEVEVVEACRDALEAKVADGSLVLPEGVTYSFAGTWEHQARAQKTLSVVLPAALLLILVILQLQFRSLATSLFVFSGVFVAWAGGFLLLGLWSLPGFLDFSVFGTSMAELFQVGTLHLSVAVWVGFLALFGIATDDGVVMATYLKQVFAERQPRTQDEVRAAVIEAGSRRIRPCLMTSATTILALLPVMSSIGRGSEIMVPMAIPSFGGMLVVVVSMLMVPVLWSMRAERHVGPKR